LDPNAKTGPAGYGAQGFIAGNTLLPYRIDFENDPTATAPAQRVVVTDPLDSNMDWNTLAFIEVGFGDNNIIIPAGSQHFQTSVAMTYNGLTFEVLIELGLNTSTGLITATFQSIDPASNLPPADVLTGFLPPENGTGRGLGYFSYTVMPKAGLPTGTAIRNVATVVFDVNPPITTDQVSETDPSKGIDPAKQALNTIDSGAPTSSVSPLPAVSSTAALTVSWSGQDDTGGSGIATFEVFVSTDGGPFTPFQTATTATTATFNGAFGHSYGFYSVATDHVGLVQSTPSKAQATTVTTQSALQTTRLTAVSGAGIYAGNATLTATLTASGTPLAGKTVSFTWNIGGTITALGSATTNNRGVATLGGITLAGINAGTYAGAVGAAFVADATDAASAASGDLTVNPKSRPVPPVTVLGIHWQTRKLARKKTASVLVVSFSDALNPRDAQSLSAFHLVAAGKDKKFGTRDDKSVPIASATYDPLAHTMTLTPRGKIPNQTLQLSISAAPILDSLGRPIDGNRDGQPGGDFKAQFQRSYPHSLKLRAHSSAMRRRSASASSSWRFLR
jgi:hypothetical protein